MKALIVVPTYNGGLLWETVARKIREYSPDGTFIQVIDSNSKDKTVEISKRYGFSVHEIDSSEFNHGGTRNLAVDLNCYKYDVVIFLTQDAIPEKGFFENILYAFEDPSIACAYGRQLPHDDANPMAKHARLFNYKNKSYTSSLEDRKTMGIKTVFLSNSFSAYRMSTFIELGGFPNNTILSEDMYFAARAVLSNYKISYSSDAVVKHSHNYTMIEEFRRYFDIGVFHADEPWIRKKFGGAGGEGVKFIQSEISYLFRNKKSLIIKSVVNNFSKFLGYKLGQNYKILPKKINLKLSMHKKYW